MRRLQLLFGVILVAMLAVTARASLDRSVLEAGDGLWHDWWFRATFADAYFGFLTVYVWVWYREGAWGPRLVWGILFALLGNIAMSIYVLRAILRLPADATAERLLLRERSR